MSPKPKLVTDRRDQLIVYLYLKYAACLTDKELWARNRGRLLVLESLCKRTTAYEIGVDIG